MSIDRRILLKAGLAMTPLGALTSASAHAQSASATTTSTKNIHNQLPLVGLGSWITFNVGDDAALLEECTKVISAFIQGGGRLIDSSPMYGSSQATIGYALRKLGYPASVFSAEKVWTSSQSNGPKQIEQTRRHWGVERFDLMQIHNLVNWQGHLETLAAMKAEGRLGAIGITTSHGARHEMLEKIMTQQSIDFVQLTYNVVDRDVEQRLLPLAQERGIGVIVNRPYRRGGLIRWSDGKALPGWVAETGASSWAQFLLKFAVSHPAVTCAIPATTRVDHVRENLQVATGTMPDQKLRERMANYVRQL